MTEDDKVSMIWHVFIQWLATHNRLEEYLDGIGREGSAFKAGVRYEIHSQGLLSRLTGSCMLGDYESGEEMWDKMLYMWRDIERTLVAHLNVIDTEREVKK